jgi:metal-responsive CopG/Arc/MetJ family transcriptional regulator
MRKITISLPDELYAELQEVSVASESTVTRRSFGLVTWWRVN